MVDVGYSGNELYIDEQTIELPESINQVIELGNRIIIRIDTLGKSNDPDNVWAFGTDGVIHWKIQTDDSYDGGSHPYTHISVKNGALWASNWNGYTYKIDLDSGVILDKEFTK